MAENNEFDIRDFLSNLETAYDSGDLVQVRQLLDALPNEYVDEHVLYDNLPPLVIAIVNNDIVGVQKLLDKGAYPDLYMGDGETPLTAAAGVGNVDIINLLLDRGANINKGAPLVHAARNGHADAVRLLLERGANIHRVDYEGNTALHGAAVSGNIHIARIMLELGVDRNVVNRDGQTAVDVARREGHSKMATFISGYFERKTGRTLAAIKNTLKYLPPEVGALVGTCYTGEKGTYEQQRAALRKKASLTPNATNIRATAGVEPSVHGPAGAAPEPVRQPLGGAGGPAYQDPDDEALEKAIKALRTWRNTQKKPRKHARKTRTRTRT